MNKHASALKAEQAPDFFTGISVTIDQIDDDVRKELPILLRHLVTAHRAKDSVAMKLSAEALAKFTGGMQGVANSVVRASLTHIHRRPRP
jgi:hypothetical protein